VLLLDGALRVCGAANTLPVLGRTAEALAGRTFPRALAVDDVELGLALHAIAGAERAPLARELLVPTPRGPRTFALRAAGGPDDRIVVVLDDIHDERARWQALVVAHDELARRVRILDDASTIDAALARVAMLVQHADRDASDVVSHALPSLFPGLRSALFVESDDRLELVRCGDGDDGHAFVSSDLCWALRTRRVHVSGRGALPRCDHVDDTGEAACLPLLQGGRPFGLVVVAATATTLLPPIAELEHVAGRLGVALGANGHAVVLDDGVAPRAER
jgi:hypothetical protein